MPLGQWVNKKTGSPIANPCLIGCILVGAHLILFRVPLDEYNEGGGFLTLCLTPATISLALPIYRQLEVLKKHLLPILAGALAGSAASIGSVYLFGKLFGLDRQMIFSLLPKSVTTPIGVALSQSMGGLTAVTSLAIVFTGIVGAGLSAHGAQAPRHQASGRHRHRHWHRLPCGRYLARAGARRG